MRRPPIPGAQSRCAVSGKLNYLVAGESASTVIVKDVDTRFGQPLTTGLAFIYDSEDAMQIEPKYILERHGAEAAEESSEPAAKPAADAEPPAEIEEDVSGGEE